ncbi:MAG: 23S rRNA (uracil(1939)-C(5))-methyltransferase RlmD [Peptoniphilaceae bacterium]|nr:23S rRNA (uracil(1939)-C(5))-methyltransferase RlmD [Peptoniphilaceae bacterium]
MDDFSLVIDDLTQEGEGVGHLSASDRLFERDGRTSALGDDPRVGMAVFVPGVLPGDIVRVHPMRKKKHRVEGVSRVLLRPSDRRRPSPCPHASVCDGCPLIAWKEEAQKEWKLETVRAALTRLGGFAEAELPVFSWLSADPIGYRNKVNLRVTSDGRLGYSKRGSHDVFPVTQCVIAHPLLQDVIQRWNAKAMKDPRWSSLVNPIRMVVLRVSSTDEMMMALVTDPIDGKSRAALWKALRPFGATVLCQSANARPGDVRLREPVFYATDRRALHTTIDGLQFSVSPASFFQVNRFLTPRLYETALEAIPSHADASVIDLYCGTGTTSLLLAQKVKEVIGVEVVRQAVNDARQNAVENGIENVTFLPARAEDVIDELTRKTSPATVGLVDPPRKGLDRAVREALAMSALQRLIYISCNPASLARDLHDLLAAGFRLQALTVCDMFAQTTEIETVSVLSRTEEE